MICTLFSNSFSGDYHWFTLPRYGYQVAGNGRWISLSLKKPKAKGGTARKKKATATSQITENDEDMEDGDEVVRTALTTSISTC
jgi:hypothetical protein